MKTSELRKMASVYRQRLNSGQRIHDNSGHYAEEIIRLREALADAVGVLAMAKFQETAKALRSLLAEHDE